MKQPNWTRVLTILLVILASYAILYVTGSILVRFAGAILLFVLGAMLAYVLSPLVARLEVAFHARWLAILLSYLLVAAALVGLAVMLFSPFVQQSQSLVDNLHNPASSSLQRIARVQRDAALVRAMLDHQKQSVLAGKSVTASAVTRTSGAIGALTSEVQNLQRGGPLRAPKLHEENGIRQRGAAPPLQTRVPASYVNSVLAPLLRVRSNYAQVTSGNFAVPTGQIVAADRNAREMARAATAMYHTVSTTPILLLHAQSWLDDHHIKVDLSSKFGQVAHQISNQGTTLLDNAITILSETATILLDTILVLIISIYLLSDGGRMVRSSVNLVPEHLREQAWFFISSLDKVLGGYIRGQLFLSALAGVLGGGAAAVLGVPYPLLIGIMTFILESVPVIGPMVAAVPAVAISLVFNPPLTTIVLFVWFIVYQQIVTNILGPRIFGMAVGIHPLEALAAVLIGYPLGGLLGAFLAVPIAGVLHILIREAYAYFVLGHDLPTAPVPVEVEEDVPPPEPQERVSIAR
jgi:predicted PurR-regulated permease PerM